MKQYYYFLINLLSLLEISSCGSVVFAQIAERGAPASFAYVDSLQLRSSNSPLTVQIDFDVATLQAEDLIAEENGALPRTSVIIPVDLNMDNAGEWSVLPNGIKIWRLMVRTPDAIAVMFYYDRFFIPDGGKLFIYNADRTHLLGAFTSKTNPCDKKFATEFVAGDDIILEYNEMQPPSSTKPDIQISGIGYGYHYLEVYQSDVPPLNGKEIGGGSNQSCQVNINCPEGISWQDQKKGVAKTVAPIGNSGYLCSGSLVNNTAQDLKPYYLSANHCFNDPEISFDQIIFYFHYESPECSAAIPTDTKTIVGAQLLVDLPIDGSSDGALLKLNSDIPDDYGIYYNGWDRRNSATTGGVGIHHPKGEVKKIATFTTAATSSSWMGSNGVSGADDAHWYVVYEKTQSGYSQPEGGSSGSPLFNRDGLVVGTLTGGSPANCSTGSFNKYGKLWYHWNNASTVDSKTMKDYLDPLNTGVETLNGIYNTVTGNTDLAGMAVKPGELVPLFNAFQTHYTVNVSGSTESITVTATPTDGDATVTGTGSHPLHVGANMIRVVVTAPHNQTSKTYTIVVHRAAVLSADKYEPNNTLAQAFSLPVSFSNDTAKVETAGSNFHNDTDIDYYRIELPSGYHYSILANVQDLRHSDDDNIYSVDARFTCSTNGQDWSEDYDDVMQGNIVVLNGGMVYFRISPYFEGDAGAYLLRLNIERKKAGTNSDAGLSALSVSPGVLSPNLHANTTVYSANVRNSVDQVSVMATPTNRNAIVSGVGYHRIQVGNNTIPVVVTAQNGMSQKQYTITVIRHAEAGSDANLHSMTIDMGVLSPIFDSNHTGYSVNVGKNVDRITVSATAADEYASVAGTGEYQLSVGNNEINIVVTAENGSTLKRYKLDVYRSGSDNVNLRNLTVDNGFLAPVFNPDIIRYTVLVGGNVECILVDAETADPEADISGNGYHTLTFGRNTINILVTSPDKSTQKSYTVEITRDPKIVGTENISHHPIIAYPNPAREQITISGLTGCGVLTVFNSLGQACFRRNITSAEEKISVNGLSPGIYFIKATEEGKSGIIKIMVK